MSLRRCSHGPANVIPPVWRCHCGPERTLSESVHWLRPVVRRFIPVPATKSRLWPLSYQTQTRVHSPHCEDAVRFGGPCKGLPSAPPHGDSVHPLSGPSRAPTCIVRRPSPRLRSGRQRRTKTETDRLTGPDSGLQTRYHHVREPHRHLVHFRSCRCPVGVEGTPESDCSLRFSRVSLTLTPRFQLRNRPSCNLPSGEIFCTRVKHRQRHLESRAP